MLWEKLRGKKGQGPKEQLIPPMAGFPNPTISEQHKYWCNEWIKRTGRADLSVDDWTGDWLICHHHWVYKLDPKDGIYKLPIFRNEKGQYTIPMQYPPDKPIFDILGSCQPAAPIQPRATSNSLSASAEVPTLADQLPNFLSFDKLPSFEKLKKKW